MQINLHDAIKMGFTHSANIEGLLIELNEYMDLDDIWHFRFLSKDNVIYWDKTLIPF